MPALTPNDAPKGTIAIEIRVIAPKTTKLVLAYKFSLSEKLIIFAPKTRVGIYSGIIIIGVSTLALLTEKVKHEPKTAIKLRAGVPNSNPIISQYKSVFDNPNMIERTGVKIIIGKQTPIQCAIPFNVKIISKGIGDISKRSRLPLW